VEELEMKRPKQLPAVDRNTDKKSAAVPAGSKVKASWDWQTALAGILQ
jgi:hypothetical protein